MAEVYDARVKYETYDAFEQQSTAYEFNELARSDAGQAQSRVTTRGGLLGGSP